ncbi:cation:proton antiporter [Spongiactinospora sp. TRM90649]|uniref:cation:proton antiporter domain-containing protein n=1 Tax=Spongiactinospora sp. TRM90649 TaxID=3031114 RepID=UPI0023F634AB|nr:cation:proton antiporter [Spongiactinospora sp. TRM90649]MDF5753478.1 cation:proton antiporter [Spongiactinospora sp. TRM90649]
MSYDTAARFLIAVSLIVLCAHVTGSVLRLLRQPRVVGEIAGGLLIGPTAVGALWPDGHAAVFTPDVIRAVDLMAQLGLVFFVFLLGAELRVERRDGWWGLLTRLVAGALLVPFALGAVLGIATGERLAGAGVPQPAFVLFLGLALSITALPVLGRILVEHGLQHTRLGVLALTTAALGDGAAWAGLLLILVGVGAAGGGWLGLVLAVALGVVLVAVVRPLLRTLFRASGGGTGRTHLLAPAVIAGLMICAALSQMAGMHMAIGAFLFGLVMPRDLPHLERFTASFHGFTMVVLLPLFFAGIGLRMSLPELFGQASAAWLFCLVVAMAIGSKYAGTMAGAMLAGLPRRDAFVLGTLMNCRGVTELVVASVGLQHGLINELGFTVLVLVALVTTALTGPTLIMLRNSDESGTLDGPAGEAPREAVTGAGAELGR